MARKRGEIPKARGRIRPVRDRIEPAGAADVPAPADTGEDGEAEPHPLPFAVVGIGASAGGLAAFRELLGALPVDTGMAFVLVPHLSPDHESLMAQILDRSSTIPVLEVDDEPTVEPNHVYVIPPGRVMEIRGGKLRLLPRPPGARRAIDQFLKSLAEDQRSMAIGVVLSGTGNDGADGIGQIKAFGGITFAQDGAEQDGMPHAAIRTGCVDFVLPAEAIAAELARLARHPFLALANATGDRPADRAPVERVIGIIDDVTGDDFTHYKRNTIGRRIARRMVLHRMDHIADYVRFLEANPGEARALHDDILISVTSFFRNPEAFDSLRDHVFRALTADGERHDPVRLWVLGCSTGEEAYSLAIGLTEFAEASGKVFPVQIFATDLNGKGIEHARSGYYSRAIADEMSPERLRRFFVEADGKYRIAKSIRDMCVFAKHNALTDPPFSRVDLISCRNLLIYLDPVLQQRLLPVLHYALKPDGFLWLGSSETIGAHRNLFDVIDSKARIYARKGTAAHVALRTGYSRASAPTAATGRAATAHQVPAATVDTPHREADRILLNRYTPASVLVTVDGEVLQFRGDTEPYLSHGPGKASFDLLKMLREGLLVPVRAALQRARPRDATSAHEGGARVRYKGEYRMVDVEVVPIRGATRADDTFLVLFDSAAASDTQPALEDSPDEHAEVTRLAGELAATKDYLQSVIEQQEAANEELQAANEEVQSTNEELQSINEELETSKEEIQSSNEELATVNDELQLRNAEVTQGNNDLLNLVTSVELAIVMLGPDLRIRRFTHAAERLLNLIASDVGRSIGDIRLNVVDDNLPAMLSEVVSTAQPREREAQDKSGRWYSMRVRPYRTAEGRVDGAVIVLVDIETIKRAESSVRESEARFRLLANNAPVLIWLDDQTGLQFANQAFLEFLGRDESELVGGDWRQYIHPDDRDGFAARYQKSLAAHARFEGQGRVRRHDGEYRWMKCMAVPRGGASERHRGFVGSMVDVTDLKEAEEELRNADRSKNDFLAMLAHELRNPLAPLQNIARLLKSGHAGAETSEWALDVLDRQTHALVRMVDDLLDVTRITRGRMQLRREIVDLRAVVERATETVQHQIREHDQHLVLQLPDAAVHVDGDPVRLQQVFGNLLHNASKFTPVGGRITLSVQAATQLSAGESRAGVEVRVRDEGIGMNAGTVATIFNPFMQADRAIDRAHGGLGIGLTLVQRLVEMHGGEVTAASEGLDRGSEFMVWLPVAAGAPAPRPAAVPRPAALRPRRILLVDDNVDAGTALATLLRLAGHNVTELRDGREVAERARQLRPDVVILDLGLPGRNGYDVASGLRSDPETANVLLLALTGYGGAEERRRTREAGFDEHYTKPLDHEVLLDRIDCEPLR